MRQVEEAIPVWLFQGLGKPSLRGTLRREEPKRYVVFLKDGSTVEVSYASKEPISKFDEEE